MNNKSVLYLSYYGMLEPVGQSQVLAYLKKLSKFNQLYLISFEKSNDLKNTSELLRIERELSDVGIRWYTLRYHKWPSSLATAFDIFCAIIIGLYLVKRYKINIIHARSYVPALAAVIIKSFIGTKYLFDMRGFWADEKVDGGLWKSTSLLFKLTKKFEKIFLLSADHVVTLTNAAVNEIQKFPYLKEHFLPITVIPTCVDLTRFTPNFNKESYRSTRVFTLGYVGSVGTYYMFDEVINCFKKLQLLRPNIHFLILNRGQHCYIRQRLSAAGISENKVEILSVNHKEMPSQIKRMDAGIFFIKPVYSKQASAPTKLAEFLGCGIPCLSNSGVGDMSDLLEGEEIGVAIKSFDMETLSLDLKRFLSLVDNPYTSSQCIEVARRFFSLDIGVERYREIYDLLS
jgi:glycosyltransferase involved in cell wall biosynthesis